jgi:PAS domain S-box-containing protein
MNGPITLLVGLVVFLALQSVLLSLFLARNMHARRALAEAERDYRSIFDNAIDGIYRSSLEGRQLRANPALAHLNGYANEAEMLAAVNDIAKEWYVDSGRRAEFKRLLDEKDSVENFVSEIYRHKTRERIWISESARLVRDAQGRPLFYEGTVRDITARRRIELELIQARQQAETAAEAKSRLLANASHELRTPLNAILGFSEVIHREMLGPIGKERYRQYAKDIHDSGLHLLGIVNDLLDLSKIEANRQELREETIAVGELFETASRFLSEWAENAGLSVTISLPPDLPAIRGDRRALIQVLLNLLSNAVKFTPAGGVITLAADRGSDGGMIFTVRDNGIGIAPADMPKALEPFGLVDTAMSLKHRGTGLGLPICRALVELHAGRFELASEPRIGTTASVHLPAERVVT